jgi:type VI secretion system protein ImpJ
MDIERSLFWHQGLFLQPQHFQLEARHFSSLLKPYQKFLQPHTWGLGRIQVSASALGSHSFSLQKGEFLFPDGTYAVLPGNAVIQTRSFDDAWIEGGKPLKVYVGLHNWKEEGGNVTILPNLELLGEVTTRFVTTADPEEVPDLHQDGPAAQVKRLHHAVKIFWETEKDQLGDYTLLPVAQLERSGDDILLSQQFIPPCLTITAVEPILQTVREIRDQIASRSYQLESYKQTRGIHTAEFGARDMVFLLALRTLNRYCPLLFHLTESGQQVHPWHAFALLRQLVGELSTFSTEVGVLGALGDGTQLLAPYDHHHLWHCFFSAKATITRLLDEITAGPEYIIELVDDGTYFAAELQAKLFEGANRFYLVLETDDDPQAVRGALDGIAKIAPRETLPILIARALPGIKLDYLAVPPQELPRRARAVYFQVDHHGDMWREVQTRKNLALYWDAAPEDLKVELMIVERG